MGPELGHLSQEWGGAAGHHAAGRCRDRIRNLLVLMATSASFLLHF